jgi:hypothetical protein
MKIFNHARFLKEWQNIDREEMIDIRYLIGGIVIDLLGVWCRNGGIRGNELQMD